MSFKPERFIGRVSYIRQNNDDLISYPYETAIQLLRQITKYKTPLEKMMIIASISSEISDCINDFWSQLDNYTKDGFLSIEAEQLQNIFTYIIIQSDIEDFFVHLKIIKLFITSEIKKTQIGNYFSSVEANIAYINTLKNSDK